MNCKINKIRKNIQNHLESLEFAFYLFFSMRLSIFFQKKQTCNYVVYVQFLSKTQEKQPLSILKQPFIKSNIYKHFLSLTFQKTVNINTFNDLFQIQSKMASTCLIKISSLIERYIQLTYNIQNSQKMSFSFQSNYIILHLMNVQFPYFSNQHHLIPIYDYNLKSAQSYFQQKPQVLLIQPQSNLISLPSNPLLSLQASPTLPKTDQNKKQQRFDKSFSQQIKSAKKNSQSNIVHQFFSFFSNRSKTQQIVEKCAQMIKKSPSQIQKIIPIFYTAIKYVNCKRGRKYVNMATFLKMLNYGQSSQYLSEIKNRIQLLEFLNMDELCQIFRRCGRYFLKEVSINAILTSKRISIVSKSQHLKRRRMILPIIEKQ